MAHKISFVLPRVLFCLASVGACICGSALTQAQTSRIAGDWHGAGNVVLPGSLAPTSPLDPKPSFTRIAAPANARLERMILLLSPSTAQQQALTTRLADQQNPASASYHQWLSASAFADAFSNSPTDVAAIAAWLAGEGFEVAPLPQSRTWIEFSGTVAQVEQAFNTRIDAVGAAAVGPAAAPRFVLADNIAVPDPLAPLIQGLVSLDGVLAAPALTEPLSVSITATELAHQPSSAHVQALTPGLVASLLHADSLHAAGTLGTGESIAIPTRGNINPTDIAAFRAAFDLPASPARVETLGPDPSLNADQPEATLLASWTGAIAPKAQIVVAPASTTAATDGIDLALAGLIDQAIAHTVVVGYSTCEAALTPAHQAFYAALYRQAAAEGISIIAAAGDNGSSACHLAGSATPVTGGYAVNVLASTPWNTAVGVSSFGLDGPSTEAASLSAWTAHATAESTYAGGGGSSSLYPAPDWQPTPAKSEHAANPSPNPNRLLPDLALPAAIDASNPGLAFCLSRDGKTSGCTLMRAGGSSASAALFAGIAALIQQKNGQQGNLAPRLYALSRQSGIFTDIVEGAAKLPCAAGTPNCDADELIGFSAAPGYDLATGLGNLNADALVNRWAGPEATGTSPTTVTLALSPTASNSTYNPTATITLSSTVTSSAGGATPTGTVTFFNTSTAQNISSATLDSTGAASVTLEGKFNLGGNEIIAIYSGDSTYAVAESTPPVNVNMQPSTTVLTVVPSATSVDPGKSLTVTATLTIGSPAAGSVPPTGTVTLDMDGLPTTTAPLATAGGVTSAAFTLTIPATSTLAAHSLQAVYAGNANYSASTSTPVSVTVGKTATTTTVSPTTTAPTAGSSLDVTATVSATGSSTALPTGTVNFLLDNVSQGVVAVSTTAPITAAVTIPSVAAGAHVLEAIYSGDTSFATSTSSPVSLTAAKTASVTTLTATPATLTLNSTETLTAVVAAANPVLGATYTFGGTVSFYDGTATLLGTANVTSGTATLSKVALAPNAAHSITAVYSGDANWMASTSAALALAAATAPDTIVLAANLSTISSGQALILTATVTPDATPAAGFEANPSGNVIFYSGTNIIGTVALVAAPIGDSSVATLTTASLTGGNDSLSAAYAGDTYYNPSTSNVLTLGVEDFSIVPSPANPGTNLNIVQGTAGSAAFVVTGVGGYNNTVQVVCAVPTPDNMTCGVSPQDIATPGTATFVIQTYLPGQQVSTSATASHRTPGLWSRAIGGTALATLVFFVLPFGRRTRIFAHAATRRLCILFLLLAGLAGGLTSCTSGGAAINTAATPLGVATLKITASANIDNTVVSHSVYLTVNVISPTAATP